MWRDPDNKARQKYKRRKKKDALKTALRLLKRDGAPEKGSDEVRVYPRLGKAIASDRQMVAFRTPNGRLFAFLERPWSDDENTHIVARDAIVLEPLTQIFHDYGSQFGSYPGNYTDVAKHIEIRANDFRLRKNRLKAEKDKSGLKDKMNAHVAVYYGWQQGRAKDLAIAFERAADAMGIQVSSDMPGFRQLCQVDPSCHLFKRVEGAPAVA
jgi:hypothetical protein